MWGDWLCRLLRCSAGVFGKSGSADGSATSRLRDEPCGSCPVKQHPDKALITLAIRDADQAMKTSPHSVMDKKQTSPSGDKHDWYTQAGYWWPDPKNPNGPYIRHDGVKNPEKGNFSDEEYFNHMVRAAETLALTYY